MKTTTAFTLLGLGFVAAQTPPYSDNPPYRCDISEKSPGSSNVQVAAQLLDEKGSIQCSHDGGDPTPIQDADGIRVYLNGNAGSVPCHDLVNKLQTLVAGCSANIGGDIRTGGTTWALNAGYGMFVSVVI